MSKRLSFINIAKMVEKYLREIPETRNDDYLLWLKVIEAGTLEEIAPFYNYMTVSRFLREANSMNIPRLKTVERARRKLQAKYPELRATKPVQEARAEKEVEYIEFARSEAI